MSNKFRHFAQVACLLAIFAATEVSAQSNAGTRRITHEFSHRAGSAEANRIQAWLEANSPELAPIRLAGEITVTNGYSLPRTVATQAGPRPDGPTAELPKTGTPGQRVSVEDEMPDGTRQYWSYEWQGSGSSGGGSWNLISYRFHLGGRGGGDKPGTQSRYR